MAVHGGAFDIPPVERSAHRAGCLGALEAGLSILRAGGPALDAVEVAIRVMEDDGTFDAGSGSFLNESGEVRLDAGMMDGRSLATGSVADVPGVPNPISLARRVLESPLAVVVGEGAREFAERAGVRVVDPADLVHPRERARWLAARGPQPAGWATAMFGDTVGAVARDSSGDLAAGTSTGGSPLKPPGRVGDSPFIGAGLYADNASAAVSATGHGEKIIPLVWSKAAADLVAEGQTAPGAARAALKLLGRLSVRAGLIIVDREGRVGVAWNTPTMAFACRSAGARTRITSGPRD